MSVDKINYIGDYLKVRDGLYINTDHISSIKVEQDKSNNHIIVIRMTTEEKFYLGDRATSSEEAKLLCEKVIKFLSQKLKK